jgi:hypothetical protein
MAAVQENAQLPQLFSSALTELQALAPMASAAETVALLEAVRENPAAQTALSKLQRGFRVARVASGLQERLMRAQCALEAQQRHAVQKLLAALVRSEDKVADLRGRLDVARAVIQNGAVATEKLAKRVRHLEEQTEPRKLRRSGRLAVGK